MTEQIDPRDDQDGDESTLVDDTPPELTVRLNSAQADFERKAAEHLAGNCDEKKLDKARKTVLRIEAEIETHIAAKSYHIKKMLEDHQSLKAEKFCDSLDQTRSALQRRAKAAASIIEALKTLGEALTEFDSSRDDAFKVARHLDRKTAEGFILRLGDKEKLNQILSGIMVNYGVNLKADRLRATSLHEDQYSFVGHVEELNAAAFEYIGGKNL